MSESETSISGGSIYDEPIQGPDIDGMRRLDYLGQMLSDEDIRSRVEGRNVDVDAVIRQVESGCPDGVETVGEWIDAAADAMEWRGE